MGKSKKLDTTCAPTKKNKLAAKNAVARKSAAKKPASVSLQKAIPELEREVKRIAELESDPMLRVILAGRDLSIANIADSIEKNFLEGKVTYDSNGAPDAALSTITANELTRFLDIIRRTSEERKKSYLEKHNTKSPVEGTPAYLKQQAEADLYYYSTVARDVGSVDWDYWASQKYLMPREFACLKFELDPKHFDFVSSSSRHFAPGSLAEPIDKIERSATRDTEEKLSPAKWIEWAQGKGYAVPEKFKKTVAEVALKAQEEIERKANEEAERTAQEEAKKNDYFIKYGAKPSARIYPVWQKRINEIAEDVKSKSKLNRYPTKGVAAKMLAIELVTKNLVAPDNISSKESQEKIEKKRANVLRHTQKEWRNDRLA